jgi:uncharacterized protein YjbI with pentapeptide repeats
LILSELRQARFGRCDLSFATFERSDMFAIEMDQCNLRGTRFEKADFSHAYSRKMVRTRAAFRNCNLEPADLTERRLASFARMKITQSQQHILLDGIGVDVHADAG